MNNTKTRSSGSLRGSTRWHCFDERGVKTICSFPPGETAPAPWIRGLGPHTPEQLLLAQARAKRTFCNVPKTEQQKERMRQAKLGRVKTPEHRANMSRAHRERAQQIREIQNTHGVTYHVACKILREQKSAHKPAQQIT